MIALNCQIRHLACSPTGARIAAAELAEEVHIWDIRQRRLISSLHTVYDSGGDRLAISEDGNICATASYRHGTIACYSTDTTNEIWHRDEVKGPQRISFSSADSRLIVGTDDGPCYILDCTTGNLIQELRDVHTIIENPWGGNSFTSGKEMRINLASGASINIPRLTFAELAVAFGHKIVCISESGGPVRAFEIGASNEIWRYHKNGCHAITLCCNESVGAVFAIEIEFERTGMCRLIRLDLVNGNMEVVRESKEFRGAVFCLGGTRAVTLGGRLIDVSSGAEFGALW